MHYQRTTLFAACERNVPGKVLKMKRPEYPLSVAVPCNLSKPFNGRCISERGMGDALDA